MALEHGQTICFEEPEVARGQGDRASRFTNTSPGSMFMCFTHCVFFQPKKKSQKKLWFSVPSLVSRSMDVYEIALNFQDSSHQGDRRKKSQQCFLVYDLGWIRHPSMILTLDFIIGNSQCQTVPPLLWWGFPKDPNIILAQRRPKQWFHNMSYLSSKHFSPKQSPDQGLAGVSSGQTNVAFSHSKSLLGTISGVERSRVQELQNPDPDKALAPHWRVTGLLSHVFKKWFHPLISNNDFAFLTSNSHVSGEQDGNNWYHNVIK